MNLNSIVAPVVAAIQPPTALIIQSSTGYVPGKDASRTPRYMTPGAITGSIAGDVLTVSAQASGVLGVGQGLHDAGNTILKNTVILKQLTGTPGGVGTYRVSKAQTFGPGDISTILVLQGSVQSLQYTDLMKLEDLNLQGERRKIYINYPLDGIVRVEGKGGDIVTTPDGRVWKVAQTLENWPGWDSVAVTLQDK
jgi:predicted heme/steroid binding protein